MENRLVGRIFLLLYTFINECRNCRPFETNLTLSLNNPYLCHWYLNNYLHTYPVIDFLSKSVSMNTVTFSYLFHVLYAFLKTWYSFFFSVSVTILVDILLAVPLTLRTITLFKWTDENGQPKSHRILDEISSRWIEAGDLLGLSPARLKGIEVYQLKEARSCCRDVLQDRIQDNQGPYSVSWVGLICLLTDMKLTILAKDLQCALRTQL